MFVIYDTTTFFILETSPSKGGSTRKLNRLRNDRPHQSLACLPATEFQKIKIPTKTVVSLLSGKEVNIPVNTPACCDPSTETYWCM